MASALLLEENISHEMIERLLLQHTNNDSVNIISSEIASDIVSRKKTLLEIVEILESLLTSTDLTKHNVGLDVIAWIVELLPRHFLSTKELEFITEFFCGQVKQHHSFISPALKGLNALVQNSQLPHQSLHNVTSTLFSNVIWQTQVVSDRRIFYSILQYIIFNRLEDFKSTSSEFLFNVISSVDGERDPRNLLLLFSFLPKLYTSISLGSLTEDAFEVVSCYFPIDFHSSTSDPATVTREDLVVALTSCLLAVPDFAKFCIDHIQEKLESTMKSAKIDSYNLLIEGCKVWPSAVIVAHSEPLWLAIKQDALPPRDAQIAEFAVHALHALVKAMPESSLNPLLSSVIHSCEGFLSNVQLSLFEPSFRLLLAALKASPPASNIVSKKLLPGLVSLLCATQDSSQILVLNKLLAFMEVFLLNNPQFDSGECSWSSLHSELSLCVERGTPEVKQTAYCALTLIAKYLHTGCRDRLYVSILLDSATLHPSPLRSACMKCLQALASIYTEEIQTKIVENLVVLQDDEELTSKQNKFELICSLAVIEKFHQVFEQQFVSLVSHGPPNTSVAITCLRNLLQEEDVQNNSSLVSFMFSQSSVMSTLMKLDTNGDDLLNLAKIIQILVSLQSSSDQKQLVQPFAKALLQHPNPTQKMVLLEALLGSLWPDVVILTPEEISSIIIPVALHSSESTLSHKSALQLLSSVINKSSDDHLLQLASQQLQGCPYNQTITAHAYITKALVVRGHPLMEHWINKLVDLLDNEEVAQAAADGIQLIVEDSQACLNQQRHCLVRLLYRQRLFHIIVPRLVCSARKVQHLKALASLLQAVPYSVYVHHIKQIRPLLVGSLDMDCERLLLTVLQTVASLLSTNDSFLEDHVDTFIPRFLQLARNNPFMQVRIAALQCLSNCLKYSPILLLPHKQKVVTELVHCLDDKKRLVRKEAARTRSKWFLLGAPTADA